MDILTLHEVGKAYKLYVHPRDRLIELLTGRRRHQESWALRGVSLALPKGACLGIVGDNGAGKSTFLKLVSGTLQPSCGGIERHGRLTAILELGAGFHPEFSGRENIYFAGALMGLDRALLQEREADIIAFSELGEAIDRAVKTYSSGMVVRLAFSLVTSVEPDILVIDEALAVGDQHFQKKCIDRMQTFRERGCTLLFCSHSLYHIREMCDRAIWIDQGTVRAQGETERVLALYEDHVRSQESSQKPIGETAPHAPPRPPSGRRGQLLSVQIMNLGPGDPPTLAGADLVIRVRVRMAVEEQPHIGVSIDRADGLGITGVATHFDGVTPLRISESDWQITLRFPSFTAHSGEYVVNAFLFDAEGLAVYEEWFKCARFFHVYKTRDVGVVSLPHEWLHDA